MTAPQLDGGPDAGDVPPRTRFGPWPLPRRGTSLIHWARSICDDNWWIKDVVDGAEDDAGFNRLLQDDYGCRRHNGRANYVFADGHLSLYNANDIRCDEGECWWSLQVNAHSRRMASAMRLGDGK